MNHPCVFQQRLRRPRRQRHGNSIKEFVTAKFDLRKATHSLPLVSGVLARQIIGLWRGANCTCLTRLNTIERIHAESPVGSATRLSSHTCLLAQVG
jgi:hypothetical protein